MIDIYVSNRTKLDRKSRFPQLNYRIAYSLRTEAVVKARLETTLKNNIIEESKRIERKPPSVFASK